MQASNAGQTWSSSIGDGSIFVVHNTKSFELIQWPDVWRSKKGAAGRVTKSFGCPELGKPPCTPEVLSLAGKAYPLNPDKSISEAFANREWAIQGNAVFGACENSDDFGCIESIQIAPKGQKEYSQAKLVSYLNPELHRVGQPEYNSIPSKSNSLWRLASAETYQVTNRATLTFTQGLVNYSDFRFAIGSMNLGESLDESIRAKVVVRVPKGIGGWFFGRMQDIGIAYNTAAGISKVTIEGQSVEVPEVSWSIDSDDLTSAQQKLIGLNWVPEQYNWSTAWVDKRVQISKIIAPHVKDKATEVSKVWSFGQNLGWWGPSRCFFEVDPVTGQQTEFAQPKVLGFVTSNAMIYDYYPASFKNGLMDFQVAGLHLMPNGALTRGHYEMVMSAEAARCFYHYTTAPISASISVVNEQGDSVVATRTVSQAGGFLKVTARNFTFSAPKVRVRISGKLQPKTTLVCIKGKTIRKVVGWEPTCPPGFAPKK